MLSQSVIEKAFEDVSDTINREAAKSKSFKFEMSISRGDDSSAEFYSLMNGLEQRLLGRYKGYHVRAEMSQCVTAIQIYVASLD
ncbi:hypothetical protein [Pseudomonas japonica]|uniref:Uncharacterized protein n=1 Tax=Pseudomonas japonica TaxID=256466 RepID=A0A239G7V7_9PSED|nr:hypothetical protein [Pseudomonas japonica]SNS65199.1 hypothetical protein SAMN05444352_11213 [Pseudomonas japonica]